MNYLKSLEYKEGKDNLHREFREAFLSIEGYYVQVYTEQSYEVQSSLKQILNDFLMAQEAERPIEAIAGHDVKGYALNIIKSKFKVKKSPLYWITGFMTVAWLFLFLLFVRTLTIADNIDYTFTEKLRLIYFNIDLLIVIALAFLFEYIRKNIIERLFYRIGAIKATHFILTLPIALLTIFYTSYTSFYANASGFRIPLSLFLTLGFITTTYLIVACIISYRKTRAKKRALVTYEEISIEQVDCPSCGHRHDIDYPKCPKCGYHSE